MSPDAIQASIADAIDQIGQPLTLRRLAVVPGNKTVGFDIGMRGCVRGYLPHELSDTIAQGDREVVISDVPIEARQWPGPPARNDLVLLEGGSLVARVLAVNSLSLGDVTLKHTMQVRGG